MKSTDPLIAAWLQERSILSGKLTEVEQSYNAENPNQELFFDFLQTLQSYVSPSPEQILWKIHEKMLEEIYNASQTTTNETLTKYRCNKLLSNSRDICSTIDCNIRAIS